MQAIDQRELLGVTRQLVVLPTGAGKAQPTDEPVLTASGWRPIGDLAPGNLVIGEHGYATEVLSVHPQGQRPIARVRFTDGAETRCDWDHLWAVETKTHRFENRSMRRGRTCPRPPRVLTLREIVAEGLRDQSGWRHFIPLVAPIVHDRVHLPLHPYLLGVLLGDGGLSIRGKVSVHTQNDVAALLPLPDGVHLTRCSDAGGGASNYRISGPSYRICNPVLDAVRALDLEGRHSYEKFIPKPYLFGCPEDRYALLQGLLDTDGTVTKSGGASYCTSSERLATDVASLVRSLGGTCRTSSKTPTYTYRGERRQGRRAYNLTVALPELCPFRVARKADQWRSRSKYQPARAIAAVEDAGVAECVCIQVEDDKQLYVTRDYVVTHNTIVAAHLIAERRQRAASTGQGSGRALFLAHRDELITQTVDKLHQVAPGLEVGVVKAERDETGADVVVGSVQTLARPSRLARLEPDFDLIVADESHHAVSTTWLGVLSGLGAMRDDGRGPLLVGITATPERSDRVGLGQVWQEVVYSRSILEMITDGYLVDARGLMVSTPADLAKLRTSHGDLVDAELGAELVRSGALGSIAEAYATHARDRKGVAFTPTVETAYSLAEALRAEGIPAEGIDGTVPREQRRAILGRLHTGETQVVACAQLLSEGWDEPSISCVLMARPTRSRPAYIQAVGRGLRIYPGKTDCLILDVAGATARLDLMTVADLAGLSKQEVQGRTIAEAVAAKQAQEAQERQQTEALKVATATAATSLFRSKLRWIQAGGTFVLSVDGGMIRLEPEGTGETWRVRRDLRNDRRIVAEGLSLEYAQGLGEDQVRQLGASTLAQADAPWRERPPTDKQRAFLHRNRIAIPDGATRGWAADKITALIAQQPSRPRNGSKGRRR